MVSGMLVARICPQYLLCASEMALFSALLKCLVCFSLPLNDFKCVCACVNKKKERSSSTKCNLNCN